MFLLPIIARNLAKATMNYLIGGLSIAVAILLRFYSGPNYPIWIPLGVAALLGGVFLVASRAARNAVVIDVKLIDPDDPAAGKKRGNSVSGKSKPFKISGETKRLRGVVEIPDWLGRSSIRFKEYQDGYSVELSGYPGGVERNEGENMFTIQEGVDDFEFTAIIKRETNSGGTYKMKVRDDINSHLNETYRIRIESL